MTARRRRWSAAGVLVALAMSCTGCSFGADSTQLVPTTGPLAVYPMPSEGLADQVSGTLELRGSCLVLRAADDTVVLPVFPSGTAQWDGSVLLVGGESFATGATMTLTGGVVPENLLGPMTYIPQGCERTENFFVAPA